MTTPVRAREMGRPLSRVEGRAKVTGTAPYAYEFPVLDPLYVYPVQATIARGRITGIDASAANALDGVVTVLTHENAPRLASDEDSELLVLQSEEVSYRGEIVGAVLAETSEIARHGAELVRVEYAEQPHDVELRIDRDDLYTPKVLNAGYAPDTDQGDVEEALRSAAVTLDETYTTPFEHNNPMEPHASIAQWTDDGLTMYDSTQGPSRVRTALAEVFGVDVAQVRVISPYVGGGFGSKGSPHPHNVLVGLAAKVARGRPVKFAATRQQMFSFLGYRTPTIQRIRLGADTDGHLTAIVHDVVELTAKVKEFAEQTATPTRMMYASPNRSTSHRLAALDLPVPAWMRAPGVTPGMYAFEVAMDELALRCGVDPVELRIRNEPEVDPQTGRPWSSRNLLACLREGARRFEWEERDPTPAVRWHGDWLVGTGVASSRYPVHLLPGSAASIGLGADGRYDVSIAAADIGTGAWTVLAQIAADALEVPLEGVNLRIGDSELPPGSVAGGSSGTSSWGSTIVAAAEAFRTKYGDRPESGADVTVDMPQNPNLAKYAMDTFGAQFAQVRVHPGTGEVRVDRMLGVFAAGRILNPRMARSQLIGGMTMGISMALYEDSILDPRFGHIVNHDFATYHIAANADIGDVDAIWVEEDDPYVNPMGAKGIGEVGISGTAAAVANAIYHATGIRRRDLPLTPDKLLTDTYVPRV
ncbi:xanthine dehydrogenase family protein molybdopterin-binding subunit [Actinopolymorpha pittospori]